MRAADVSTEHFIGNTSILSRASRAPLKRETGALLEQPARKIHRAILKKESKTCLGVGAHCVHSRLNALIHMESINSLANIRMHMWIEGQTIKNSGLIPILDRSIDGQMDANIYLSISPGFPSCK